MAKRENKKTRESQYVEILSKQGVTLAACSVLGFRFPDDMHAHGFHFDLMNADESVKRDWLLFDSMADGTAIVVLRGTEQADRIRAIAEQAGGTEYKVNLKQKKRAGHL